MSDRLKKEIALGQVYSTSTTSAQDSVHAADMDSFSLHGPATEICDRLLALLHELPPTTFPL